MKFEENALRGGQEAYGPNIEVTMTDEGTVRYSKAQRLRQEETTKRMTARRPVRNRHREYGKIRSKLMREFKIQRSATATNLETGM